MGVDYGQAQESLKEAIKSLEKIDNWTQKEIQTQLLKTVEELGIKNGQLLWPVRAALSGMQFSPGVFELAWVLEKEETLNRLKKANEIS